jgi:hypothetical protein
MLTRIKDPMKLPASRAAVVRALALLSVLATAATGCADAGDTLPVDEPDPVPSGHVDLGEYVIHLSPKRGTVTLDRLRHRAAGPGLGAQSVDAITVDQDDIPGVGPANTVELVTNSTGTDSACPVGYQAKSFCGNVTMRSFYAGRALSNVYLQVTRITDEAGVDTATHSGMNSDPAFSGLSNALGLWKFTGSGVTSPGVLAQAVATSLGGDAGARNLVFSNPDDADTSIYMRVVATLAYSTYTMTAGTTSGFVDACTSGTKVLMYNDGITMAQLALPFPFTLYGTTYSPPAATGKLTISRFGSLGFGNLGTANGSPYNTGANLALPTTSAAAFQPGIFPFWDDLNYTTNLAASGVCTLVSGVAPNRQLVVTWKNMKFTNDSNGTANMTFSSILSEGSDRIDFAYSSMTASSQVRANGNSATIGVQSASGTAAKALYNVANSAGTAATKSYALVPQP